MRTKSSLSKHVALAVGIFSIVLLGNLRSQASEMPSRHLAGTSASNDASPSPRVPVMPSTQADPNLYERVGLAANAADGIAGVDADADGVAQDEAQLVPAIYAWDPDVRFVYFRHVSKWM